MKKEIMLRTSERSTYKRCRQRWHWSYIDRYNSPRSKVPLQFGSMIHEALEQYYIPGKKRGPHPREIFIDLFDKNPIEGTSYSDEGEAMDSRELGIAMMDGYVEKYGKDSMIEVIAPEQVFEIDVMDKNGKYLVTYVGKFDAIIRNLRTGKIGLFEHKTAKSIQYVRINSGYGEQGISYHWAATIWLRQEGLLKKNQELDMVTYNFLRKGLPDLRPKNKDGVSLNKDGTVSKRQPAPFFERQEMIITGEDTDNFQYRIRAEAWEMQQVRAGKIPLYKNPTRDCDWDCPFRDACEVHEMGGDYQSILDLEMVKWNPYEEHLLVEEKL